MYRSDYPAGEFYNKEYDLNLKLRSTCFSNFPNDLPIYAKDDNIIKLIVEERFFMKQDMIIEESDYKEYLDENDYEYPDYVKEKDKIEETEINNDIIYKYDNINLYEIKKQDIKIEYQGAQTLSYKDKQNSQIGTINYYYQDKLLTQEQIYLKEKINASYKKILLANKEKLKLIIISILLIIFVPVILIIVKSQKRTHK